MVYLSFAYKGLRVLHTHTHTCTHMYTHVHPHPLLATGVEDDGKQFQQDKPVMGKLGHTQLHEQFGVVVNVTLKTEGGKDYCIVDLAKSPKNDFGKFLTW